MEQDPPVHLIGRLATDVGVKEVNGGSKVSSFILAVDRSSDEAYPDGLKAPVKASTN